MVNKKLIYLLIFLAISFSVFTQEDLDSWNVAIRMPDGSAYCDDIYIIRHFMLSLKMKVEECPDHYITADDYLNREYNQQKQDIANIRTQISELVDQRNQILFDNGSAKQKRDINEKIRELNKTLEQGTQELVVTDNKTLPISISIPSVENMIFSSSMAIDQLQMLEKEFDIVISGDIEQIGDSYLFDVWIYDVNLNQKITLWLGSFAIPDIAETIDIVADSIRKTLLGRDWAGLEVKTDQNDALIYYNGLLLGTQECKSSVLIPGDGKLEIYSSGYLAQSHTVQLETNTTILEEYELLVDENALVYIDTIPQGAEIYLGSKYVGLSPLEIIRPDQEIRLSLILEGYETIHTSISPFVNTDYSFELVPFTINYTTQARLDKKKFYNSVAWFAISIGVTVIMAGIYQYYVNEYNYNVGMANSVGNLDPMYNTYVNNSHSSYENYLWSYSTFWGSLGLNLGLLGITVITLSDYLKTSEMSLDH